MFLSNDVHCRLFELLFYCYRFLFNNVTWKPCKLVNLQINNTAKKLTQHSSNLTKFHSQKVASKMLKKLSLWWPPIFLHSEVWAGVMRLEHCDMHLHKSIFYFLIIFLATIRNRDFNNLFIRKSLFSIKEIEIYLCF